MRSFSSFPPHFLLRSPSLPPSPSSSYLHRILFDCFVLLGIVIVRCRVVSLLILKILASAGATLLTPTTIFLPSLLLLSHRDGGGSWLSNKPLNAAIGQALAPILPNRTCQLRLFRTFHCEKGLQLTCWTLITIGVLHIKLMRST